MTTKALKISLLALVLASQAFAKGGSSDGGGNAVCNSITNECKMVEQFQVENLREVKGYGLFRKKLAMLKKELPDLAQAIEKAIQNKTWYVVPTQFDLLSTEQTKLKFTSDQAAFQNDEEVFISQNSLDKMDEEAAAYKLMHESLMAMQEKRDAAKVRVLTGRIFAKKPSTKLMQEAAAIHGFGTYFSPADLQRQRMTAAKSYLNHFERLVKGAIVYCDPQNPYGFKGYARKLTAQDKLDVLLGQLEKREDDVFQWSSPLARFHDGMGKSYDNLAEYALQYPVLLENPGKLPDANTEKFNLHLWKINAKQASKLDEENVQKSIARLVEPLNEDTIRIREELAKNQAFIDLLAVQKRFYPNAERDLGPRGSPEKVHQRLQPIYRQVINAMDRVPTHRQKYLNTYIHTARDPKALFQKACDDLSSVERDIQRMTGAKKDRAAEDEVQEDDSADMDAMPRQVPVRTAD